MQAIRDALYESWRPTIRRPSAAPSIRQRSAAWCQRPTTRRATAPSSVYSLRCAAAARSPTPGLRTAALDAQADQHPRWKRPCAAPLRRTDVPFGTTRPWPSSYGSRRKRSPACCTRSRRNGTSRSWSRADTRALRPALGRRGDPRAFRGAADDPVHFGDHDPTGRDIDRAVRKGIGESLQSLVRTDDREPTPDSSSLLGRLRADRRDRPADRAVVAALTADQDHGQPQ